MDPTMKKSFEGPSSGEGAIYTWSGNGSVGEGRMTIVKSVPSEQVEIQLDFVRPMAVTDQAVFTFVPENGGTKVTWTMTGKNNLLAKAIHLVVSMDKMIGPAFEQGLAALKAGAEASKKP
jgi:hypothetical protein